MDREYWNALAGSYERDLLEIVSEDGAGTVERAIAGLSSPELRVADLGCGPGSLLPALAKAFREVIAVDYSEELLEAARERCRAKNVTYLCHNLAGAKKLPIEVDVVCCLNALIDPRSEKRERMLSTVAGAAVAGGSVVVVVPAMESVFHVYHSLLRCRRRDGRGTGLGPGQAERLMRAEVESFAGGIVKVGGVATKYWMREELMMSLNDHGVTPKTICRVEYPWREEIDDPPLWLGEPGPWDWMVIGVRE